MSQPVERTIVNKSVYIALGANVTSSHGPPALTINVAIQKLEAESLTISKQSIFYQTPAFPEGSGPDFVNAVIEVETTMSPDALLARLHEVEAELGRERHARWSARTIDLDLIAYGALILPDEKSYMDWLDAPLETQKNRAPERLILPHPRLQDRSFVLGPLCDIAPDW
ncbi:MAG: 2-amino-4-hydroxy-6-hydroxymethyldihydropteridine diphosphokinase, partial [Paracoccaceae bacterium]